MTIAGETLERILQRAIAIQQVAAPTFGELRRAELVREAFFQAGLHDVSMDAIHNVYGRLPGSDGGACLVVSAHLDTVFAADTDLSVRRSGGRISGPGIGDNALGVAALVELPRLLEVMQIAPARDLWLVANVCEEGQGDLRGMRAVLERFGPSPAAWVVLEGGFLGRVSFRGIGSRRYRVAVRTEGGHSWFDFGKPSAVHVLAGLAKQLIDLHLPQRPKTTLNIGVIEGGTSVNTIAESAHLQLDLRSECPHELNGLVGRIERLQGSFAAEGADIRWETIGDRPAGGLAPEHPLVACAIGALEEAGFQGSAIDTAPASTDANIPLAAGHPAVCIGLTRGYNLHRRDEYIETEGLGTGLVQLLLLLKKLQGVQGETT